MFSLSIVKSTIVMLIVVRTLWSTSIIGWRTSRLKWSKRMVSLRRSILVLCVLLLRIAIGVIRARLILLEKGEDAIGYLGKRVGEGLMDELGSC